MEEKEKGAQIAPLEGIKVVEVAQWVAAPSAGAILGDWGADVVKIEHPVRGDGSRGMKVIGGMPVSDVNYPWELDNRNKRSVTLDISKKGGQEALHKLIAKCDVFLTSLRPSELRRYDLEYETLSKTNSRLIFASLTGYGRKGPDREKPGFDYTAFWARSGLQAIVREPGRPPVFQRPGMGDHITALAIACGINTALFVRERTGIGQEVDVALFGTGIWTLGIDTMCALVTGQYAAMRTRSEMMGMTNVYQTKDGKWIMMMHLQPDAYWSMFCKALELEHIENDERFNSFLPRLQHEGELVPIVEESMAKRTLEEWKQRMDEYGLIWAPVQEPTDVAKDPQAWATDCFETFEHPTLGPISFVAIPMKLSRTPASIRTTAPELGQHTEEALLEIGYSWDDIARLKEDGIVA